MHKYQQNMTAPCLITKIKLLFLPNAYVTWTCLTSYSSTTLLCLIHTIKIEYKYVKIFNFSLILHCFPCFQDLSVGMPGGMWLTVLTLCGINQDIIDTYKTIMAIISSVTDDFIIYFFAFIVIHIVV